MATTNTCPWGVGSKTSTLIAFEETYGALPTDVTAIKTPFNTNSVASSQNTNTPSTIRGRRDPVEAIYGNNDVSGDVVVPMDYTAIGYWFKALMGEPTTTADESGTNYTHVYKIGNSQPSFTMEKCFPGINQYIRESGCKISSMSITVGGDDELTATFNVMGAKETVNTTSMSDSPVEAVLDRANNFQAVIKIGGTEVGKVTSFSMEMDSGLDGDTYCIGNKGFREAICEGLVTLSGTIEAFYADSTYIDMAENSTETSAEIVLTNGDMSLSLLMPEVKFSRTSPGIDGPGGIKQSFDYNAFFKDSAENSALVITLVNTMASY